MDVLTKLHELMKARDWTEYKVAKESGLSESTIANIYRRNNVPTVATLEAICTGFGISLSEFFAENDMVEMTPELKDLFERWIQLSPNQKKAVYVMIDAFVKTD